MHGGKFFVLRQAMPDERSPNADLPLRSAGYEMPAALPRWTARLSVGLGSRLIVTDRAPTPGEADSIVTFAGDATT